jgi:glycosyltransferase involved in cell wall biosynthesis
LAREVPAFEGLLANKYDFGVLGRLTRLLRTRRIDAVVTVGTGGDKMFWGRLAAWRAGVPVILSALHSTGLPDHVEFLNRLLTPLSDGFIGVAQAHGAYLAAAEGCPARKVFVIPNGVDVEAFQPSAPDEGLRAALGLPPQAPLALIVAALRPEKNHELFLQAAARVTRQLPEARFLLVGDGPRRSTLEELSRSLGIQDRVLFLGTRSDVAQLLSIADVLVLSSHMEANPVSILEALACGKPVVAPRVGSIPETIEDGMNGYLFPAGDEAQLAARLGHLLECPEQARRMGAIGRERVVAHWSLERMVEGYQDLIDRIYRSKVRPRGVIRAASRPERPAAETGLADSNPRV